MTTATQLLKSFTPRVIPAESKTARSAYAGIHVATSELDPGLRRGDGEK